MHGVAPHEVRVGSHGFHLEVALEELLDFGAKAFPRRRRVVRVIRNRKYLDNLARGRLLEDYLRPIPTAVVPRFAPILPALHHAIFRDAAVELPKRGVGVLEREHA